MEHWNRDAPGSQHYVPILFGAYSMATVCSFTAGKVLSRRLAALPLGYADHKLMHVLCPCAVMLILAELFNGG